MSDNNRIRIHSWLLLIEKIIFSIVRKQNLSLSQVYPWINVNLYYKITLERHFPASPFPIFIKNVSNLSKILRSTFPAAQYKPNGTSLCQSSTFKISHHISITTTGWLCHKGTVIPVMPMAFLQLWQSTWHSKCCYPQGDHCVFIPAAASTGNCYQRGI